MPAAFERGAEHAVELGRDDHVAGLHRCDQGAALRPLAERLGAGHATFDEHALDREAVHLCVAGDGALLHVEAFALVGLHDGRDAGVAVDAAGRGRGLGPEGGTFARGRGIEEVGEAGVASAHRALGFCISYRRH